MPSSTKTVFGTVWMYAGTGPYMAVAPTTDPLWPEGWEFLSLTYPDGKLIMLAGFHGGDPEERLEGYELLEATR